VGGNEEAGKIAEVLERPSSGFVPIGLVRSEFGEAAGNGVPVLGGLDELSRLIEENDIECVFVASSAVHPEQMKTITKYVRRRGVEVRISANLTDILASRLTLQPVGNLLALCLRPVRLTGTQAALKRAFDIVLGGAAVILSLPISVTVAIVIKATSRGPVLYCKERVGRNGRTFTMYKFRTMVHGADLMRQNLVTRNEASGPLFKIRNDPRITRVGRFLRKWSLDELPQFLNVLKGDMSLVGPRPPLPAEVANYEDWHRGRLEVRPGITGLWQVRGRSELGFDDYVRMDLFYIENWSITYDLFIIAKTIPAVLSHRGAY
jgi:exopolysaccharide biosynthesis polyprenyl glycosylphosphotransferase